MKEFFKNHSNVTRDQTDNILFIDGIDGTGKSTLIRNIIKSYHPGEIHKCVLPSFAFRNSIMWKDSSKLGPKDWTLDYLTKWIDAITSDLLSYLPSTSNTSYDYFSEAVNFNTYGYRSTFIFDRGPLSTIAYQGALLLLHYDFIRPKGSKEFLRLNCPSDIGIRVINKFIPYVISKYIIALRSLNICAKSVVIGTKIPLEYYDSKFRRNASDTDTFFEKRVCPIAENIIKDLFFNPLEIREELGGENMERVFLSNDTTFNSKEEMNLKFLEYEAECNLLLSK